MLLLLTAIALATPGVDVQVQTMDGQRYDAVLRALSADSVELQVADETRSVPNRELQRMIPAASRDAVDGLPIDSIVVQLRDGSRLLASDLTVERGRVEIELVGGGTVRASSRTMQFFRFRDQDAQLSEQWHTILEDETTSDVIVIRKTSRVADAAGIERIESVLDHLEGIIGDVTSTHVGFQFDNTDVEVPRAKVEGLIYYRPPSDQPPPLVCHVITSFGSRLHAKTVSLQENQITIVTGGGVRAILPITTVRALDFAPANLTYLHALQPESVEWRPHVLAATTPPSVARWFRPRSGESTITLRGTEFENGLTLHSRTELTYRLTKRYERFRATVGIDDRFRGEGSVQLVISTEREVIYDQQISGTAPPIELDLPIAGARRLTVLVDFGADGTDWGDHLHLCNARLTK